jgi:hypothetical protein
VDVHDFGIILKDCSIQEIKSAIRSVSGFPPQKISYMMQSAWEHARAHYTRERFVERYREVIETILAAHSKHSS